MAKNYIDIVGAKVHNLKNISIKIPKNQLTVITGPSGSGKSSLAFDTIYVEGQRRYIESLSSYARQFVGMYNPADVDYITGLSPAIAIDQKTSIKNPRSTVGTITEIYDYMRLLFSKIGTLYCPHSGKEINRYSPLQVSKILVKSYKEKKLYLLAPIEIKKNTNRKLLFSKYLSMGLIRMRLNGKIYEIENEGLNQIINTPNACDLQIELIIDRVTIKKENNSRILNSIELAYNIGHGSLIALIDEKDELFFSENNISPVTKIKYPLLAPKLFSFNSPIGACPDCNGLGESKNFDIDLLILDENLSVHQGAIKNIGPKEGYLYKMILSTATQENVNIDLPLKNLPKHFQTILFYGSKKIYQYNFKTKSTHFNFQKEFPGIVGYLKNKYQSTKSVRIKKELDKFLAIKCCQACQGQRLNPIALSTRILKKNIMDICNLPFSQVLDFINEIEKLDDKSPASKKIIKELKKRVGFLYHIGLDYLFLNRATATLSGGETQRIQLATQIGSALSGVLYVLDEPTVGLHPKDNKNLLNTLCSLRDLGNTVLVVEHDEETILRADHVIDMGPGAGTSGGKIIAQGTPKNIIDNEGSITGKYLSKTIKITSPASRKKMTNFIKLKGATQNNLNNIDIDIPLKGLVCITGVSGSGKSTLVHQVLVPAIKKYLNKTKRFFTKDTNYQSISGIDSIDSIIELDQSPIGRTPHSNPATYTGIFNEIRLLFSKTKEAKIRGYDQGRFSFNIKGGRCEECEGNGLKKVEMHFLPDVYITCNECNGTRYNYDTLSILYKSKNISDILELSVGEAIPFFKNHPKIIKALITMNEIGLGYMKLGQPATTLSGGEAQRLKLSRELSKRTKGHCLYVLDEPTTGLHFDDVKNLLNAIQNLIDRGNSVLIIEHNMNVIKMADYVIDLGPLGGHRGGKVVTTGTPEEIIKCKESHTGKYLKLI